MSDALEIKDFFKLEPYQSIRTKNAWYKNIQFIGKGGNGVTFYVLCTGGDFKGQHFALKVLYKISSDERRRRFLKEVEFLKKQNHPSLLGHIDEGFFLPDKFNFPFVVTKYMPRTLADEMRLGISFQKSLIFTLQLLSSLKYLGQKQIIHRDIKPQNIFIDGSTALLGDFGLLKEIKHISEEINQDEECEDRSLLIEGASELPNEILGYVAMPKFYRTPDLVEYAKNNIQLDLKTDIFQLGLVICEMFTGLNPLVPSTGFLDDVKLKEVPQIKGMYGTRIRNAIINMLEIDRVKRQTIEQLLDRFSGIYTDYVKSVHNIEGDILSQLQK